MGGMILLSDIVAGVVRRINVYALDFPCIEWKQCFECLQIVPVDDKIVMQADLVRKAFILFGNQLMIFDKQMMVLNERFAFKLNLGHSISPFI